MILDLEQERRNGLDESQLEHAVMRLIVPGWQSECNGPWRDWHDSASLCRGCHEIFDARESHKRIPKPLCEVRDELIEWLMSNSVNVKVRYAANNKHVATHHSLTLHPGIGAADVYFNDVADTALALALGAVRLMEKT